MTKTIQNNKNVPVNVATGTIPNVGGALLNWFQPLTFTQITKEVVDFQVVETRTEIAFQGVVQPLTDRRLYLKKEGQRAWTYLWVHATPALQLEVDEVIEYLGINYRVVSRRDYGIYGYLDYEILQDWTAAQPVLTYSILHYGLTMPGEAA